MKKEVRDLYPVYKCHKIVNAAKLLAITEDHDSTETPWLLTFEDGVPNQRVSFEWYRTRKPEVGGYFVIYSDGYTSWSPGEVFEEGYTPIIGGSLNPSEVG